MVINAVIYVFVNMELLVCPTMERVCVLWDMKDEDVADAVSGSFGEYILMLKDIDYDLDKTVP